MNSLPEIQQLTPETVQHTFDAWYIVAASAGALAVQVYHTIVKGGGIRGIARKLWNGEPKQAS